MGHFLLRPRWLIGLALVIAVAVSFALLGMWQLERLDRRRAYERLVAQRLASPPVTLSEALVSNGGDLRYRRVVAEGSFDPRHEVILYGRTQAGLTGNHVLTPLVLDDGTAVAVDRGWIPLAQDDPPVVEAAPPPGRVRVTGVLFPPEAGGDTLGASATGREPVTTLTRVDLTAVAAQVPYPLAPAYLLLASQDPPQRGLPEVAPLPDAADAPPHLSYAIQWFTFATIGVVGFAVLVRREYGRTLEAETGSPADA
jgi:surfeit locus 1 family protein